LEASFSEFLPEQRNIPAAFFVVLLKMWTIHIYDARERAMLSLWEDATGKPALHRA
jgi:hypothetical protein